MSDPAHEFIVIQGENPYVEPWNDPYCRGCYATYAEAVAHCIELLDESFVLIEQLARERAWSQENLRSFCVFMYGVPRIVRRSYSLTLPDEPQYEPSKELKTRLWTLIRMLKLSKFQLGEKVTILCDTCGLQRGMEGVIDQRDFDRTGSIPPNPEWEEFVISVNHCFDGDHRNGHYMLAKNLSLVPGQRPELDLPFISIPPLR